MLFKKKQQNIIDTPHKNPYTPMALGSTLNKSSENKAILSTIRKPETVVGSYAFNRQVKYPFPYQKRPFTDIDIKSPQSKETALQIERALDHSVGMNNYYITKLEHDEGITYRVHSRSTGQVVSDVGSLKKRIPTRNIQGIPFETLKHRKQEVMRMINKPSAEYRRDKDLRMLGYIKRYEQLQRTESQKIHIKKGRGNLPRWRKTRMPWL